MAKSAQPSPVILRIDLLRPQGEPLQTPQKFLRWLLGYGRFIIIVVDIIVIGCFLLRFKLDADLQNINHQIQAEEDHISSRSQQENLVKQVHQQLQIIQQTYDNSPDWQNIFQTISAATPIGTRITKLTTDHNQTSKEIAFKITAQTNNNLEIGGFLNNLRENNKSESDRTFKDVDITSLSLNQGAILFVINGKTNK